MVMLRVGKIINTHGCRGELKVLPLTDDIKRFNHLKEAYLEMPSGEYKPVHISASRMHKDNILLTLEEIADMNMAEKIKNIYLCVTRENAIKLPKDHFFIYEIIGLNVIENDIVLGTITEVLQNSSTDLYKIENGEHTFYMPALKSVVQSIDLENKKMIVTLPKGLLSEEA